MTSSIEPTCAKSNTDITFPVPHICSSCRPVRPLFWTREASAAAAVESSHTG